MEGGLTGEFCHQGWDTEIDCRSLMTWPFIGKLVRITFWWFHLFFDARILGRNTHLVNYSQKTSVIKELRRNGHISKTETPTSELALPGQKYIRRDFFYTLFYSKITTFGCLRVRQTRYKTIFTNALHQTCGNCDSHLLKDENKCF
jgi:hypothetical protein